MPGQGLDHVARFGVSAGQPCFGILRVPGVLVGCADGACSARTFFGWHICCLTWAFARSSARFASLPMIKDFAYRGKGTSVRGASERHDGNRVGRKTSGTSDKSRSAPPETNGAGMPDGPPVHDTRS